MHELDGEWEVRRVSGVLPPLPGVRKRIAGDRGETLVPGGLAVPFDVRGLELRYRGPLRMVVDVLEPAGAGYEGRTTVLGRTIGRFALISARERESSRSPGSRAASRVEP